MGMADFYIRINYSNLESSDIEILNQKLKKYEIFRFLDEENYSSHLCIECKIDSFIPALIIVYNHLCPLRKSIDSIETHGIISEYTFADLNEFVSFVFSSNERKLIAYYEQMGYFAIRSEEYYKIRNKLKKYYIKMN